jgi:tetratricopeptide (TPR) repeat protein
MRHSPFHNTWNGECRFYEEAIMSGNGTRKQAVAYSQNPEANELFLKAREYFNKGGTLANARKAIKLYEQAVKADPKFALAFVELSRAWMTLGFSNPDGMTNKELLPHAKAAALEAVALDQKMADAHLALAGIYYSIEFDWEQAEREYKLALQLAPSSADAHGSYAAYLGSMGRFDEALTEAKKADELLPSQGADFVLARIHYDMHRYDEATAYIKRSLKEKGNMLGHFLLGFIYVGQQKYDEAIAEFKIDVGNNAGALAALTYAYAMGGKKTRR